MDINPETNHNEEKEQEAAQLQTFYKVLLQEISNIKAIAKALGESQGIVAAALIATTLRGGFHQQGMMTQQIVMALNGAQLGPPTD